MASHVEGNLDELQAQNRVHLGLPLLAMKSTLHARLASWQHAAQVARALILLCMFGL